MSFRRIFAFALASLATVTCAGLFNPARAGTLTYEIVFDTSQADSGLMPGLGGDVQVTLSAAFPPSSASVSIDVYGANTDGTLGSVSFSTPGTAGDLTTSVSQNNASNGGYSELDQNFAIAAGSFPAHSFFDVFVQVSGSEIGPGFTPSTGTAIGLNIYDNNVTEIGATGLVGGGTVTWSSFTTIGVITTPSAPITITPQTGTIPEPTSVVLLGLGLGAIAAARRFRTRRAA